GAAQFIAGLAQILGNIAQAKKILGSAPTVKAKAEGGYLFGTKNTTVTNTTNGDYITVTGDSDNRKYTALTITSPETGMLPGQPVLFTSTATGQPVLASERGAEYFVAAHDLRNPYVANLVRMID